MKVEGATAVLVDEALIEGHVPPSTSPETPAFVRVRPDLWRAAIDFRSGRQYVWDEEKGIARVGTSNEGRPFPTLSAEDLKALRQEFVDKHGSGEDLSTWLKNELNTMSLPFRLRGVWTGFFRDSVVERLTSWFAQQGLSAPELTETPPPPSVRADSLEALRTLVTACIAVMTKEEIEELRIPPQVFLRTRTGAHR